MTFMKACSKYVLLETNCLSTGHIRGCETDRSEVKLDLHLGDRKSQTCPLSPSLWVSLPPVVVHFAICAMHLQFHGPLSSWFVSIERKVWNRFGGFNLKLKGACLNNFDVSNSSNKPKLMEICSAYGKGEIWVQSYLSAIFSNSVSINVQKTS